jgi:hypothetical protein
MSDEVMTPESPRWDEFADALYDALEFTEHSSGDPAKTSWRRDGRAAKPSHRHARAVMRAMGGVDVTKSLAWFRARGGWCDCEIIFNVDGKAASSARH